jgi:hypothetical protein
MAERFRIPWTTGKIEISQSDHPITPPPELVVEWADTIYQQTGDDDQRDFYVATRAAQWGADQELEACCELLRQKGVPAWSLLRLHRRDKSPNLKEQALDELHISFDRGYLKKEAADTIRRALEQLDD